MPNQAISYVAAKLGSPFDIGALLLDAAAVAGTEGLWLPTRFAKTGSIEFAGSMTTMSASILGTNQMGEPLNQYTLTIGGTVTTNDIVTITAANPNAAGGTVAVPYPAIGGDTTTTIATKLTALINANIGMAGLGVTATSAGAVITTSFPSIWPQGNAEVPVYSVFFGNTTTFTGASSGSSTETVTVAPVTTIGSAIGSAVTALGITALSILPRWMRVRLTTLTGGGANITATFSGAA